MSTREPATSLIETVTFVVHAVKQLSWGFERLNAIADDYEDGSPAKAFYLSAIYNYIAVFYLLDRADRPMGGAFYSALERHSLQHLLTPVDTVLRQSMGTTTFGEIVRVARNKAVVHPTYRDRDLDRLYSQVDMQDAANQSRFQNLLVELARETRELAWRLIQATGLPPEHFGVHDASRGSV